MAEAFSSIIALRSVGYPIVTSKSAHSGQRYVRTSLVDAVLHLAKFHSWAQHWQRIAKSFSRNLCWLCDKTLHSLGIMAGLIATFAE